MAITHSWHSQKARWFAKPRIDTAERERRCMAFIAKCVAETGGVAPSTREMMLALDFRSTFSVHRMIDSLVAQGKLRRLPNRARAIEIVADDGPQRIAYFTVERVDGEATLVPMEA